MKALLHVTDHLGSVRAVIDGNTAEVLEASQYSAYGTRSGDTTTYRDHFTRQEDQMPDFGILYSDHGARQYSPALRRWMVPDPLSEKYYGLSPYNYCGGNPISQKDTNGKEIIDGLCDSNIFPWQYQGVPVLYRKVYFRKEDFIKFLDISSEVWLNNCLANQKNIIILHSCSTGHGEESFAQRMSKDIPNTLIFAPSDDIRIDNNKETVKNGGTWNAFVGGDKICASKIHPIIMLQIILKIQQLCAEKLNMKN